MLENKLVSVEKELQQVKKDNAALTRYINARRKKKSTKEGGGGGPKEGPKFQRCQDLEEVVLHGGPRHLFSPD
jgi:hypothetical protein